MKKLLSLFLIGIMMISCQQKSMDANPEEEITTPEETSITSTFDSIRAQKDGADEYGMRKYVMAFLKRGPNRTTDSIKAAELQTAHLANIGKMAEAGKLALAGPFFGDGDLRGIYIFAVESLEEAKSLTASDPAIQAGSLEMELMEWYGSAALMEVNDIHKVIAKTEI